MMTLKGYYFLICTVEPCLIVTGEAPFLAGAKHLSNEALQEALLMKHAGCETRRL